MHGPTKNRALIVGHESHTGAAKLLDAVDYTKNLVAVLSW